MSALYEAAAEAVLLSARQETLRAAGDGTWDGRIEHTFEAVETHILRRLGEDPADIKDWADRRTVLAGLIVAHALPGVLRDTAEHDAAAADAVAEALPVLRAEALGGRTRRDRFQAGRDVHQAASRLEACPGTPRGVVGAVGDLAGMLLRASQVLPASAGHLVRRVTADARSWQPHLAEGWCGVLGVYLLVPRMVTRAVAVGMVSAGHDKSAVARDAGISRTTLDAWLEPVQTSR